MRRSIVTLAVALLTVAGCSAPRFDATDEATFKESARRVAAGLDEAQKQLLIELALIKWAKESGYGVEPPRR